MIEVPSEICEAIVAHARFCAPHEACGLLAVDREGAIRMAYALTNVDASPRRYTVAPYEHLMALRHAERNGWTIGGVFHSHPAAVPYPSRRDVAWALDPEWIHLIAGPVGAPTLRAFRIAGGAVDELAIRVIDRPVPSAP